MTSIISGTALLSLARTTAAVPADRGDPGSAEPGRGAGSARTGAALTGSAGAVSAREASASSGQAASPLLANHDLSDHLEIAADPVALADVLNALDPAHPVRVPCLVVLAITGPVGPVPPF